MNGNLIEALQFGCNAKKEGEKNPLFILREEGISKTIQHGMMETLLVRNMGDLALSKRFVYA